MSLNDFIKDILIRSNNLIAQISLKETIERFTSTKKDPDGKLWRKTKNKTYRVARKKDGFRYYTQKSKPPKGAVGDASSGSLMYRTTGLLQSIKIAKVYDKIQLATVSTVVSSNSPYAAIHQYGDEARNIPARPFLGISQAGKNKVIEFASGLFSKKLTKFIKTKIEEKGK